MGMTVTEVTFDGQMTFTEMRQFARDQRALKKLLAEWMKANS